MQGPHTLWTVLEPAGSDRVVLHLAVPTFQFTKRLFETSYLPMPLRWPRQLPIGGGAKDTYEIVRTHSDWIVPHSQVFVRCSSRRASG